MILGPLRSAKLALWTIAGVSWSWAVVASNAESPQATGASAEPPPDALEVAAEDGTTDAAMPAGRPGRVLVLRLSQPPQPEVVVRRVYVEVPVTAGAGTASRPTTVPRTSAAPAAGSAPATTQPAVPAAPAPPPPPPPPQRSAGS